MNPKASSPVAPRGGEPWFSAAVWALDARLRARHGVFEYTRHPECMFRMQIGRAERALLFADGTHVKPGARVIDLHLWNEQMPQMGTRGPTLGWARRVTRSFELSLDELARHLESRPDLDDVEAVRVSIGLGVAGQRDQLLRIVRRYGFAGVQRPAVESLGERLHRFGENILMVMMVCARNPVALRPAILWRDRTTAYLSRRNFERQYGRGQLRSRAGRRDGGRHEATA